MQNTGDIYAFYDIKTYTHQRLSEDLINQLGFTEEQIEEHNSKWVGKIEYTYDGYSFSSEELCIEVMTERCAYMKKYCPSSYSEKEVDELFDDLYNTPYLLKDLIIQ
jgi:hypothetical protein